MSKKSTSQSATRKEGVSDSVARLQARKQAIEDEIDEIASRLHAIARVLNAEEPAPALEPTPAASGGRERRAAKIRRKANHWFASGEALNLMRRHVRSSMRPSEIVKLLARAKGLDRSLNGVQAKRFHATAYMAVANAVKGGAATKLKDGRVRMA